MGAPERQGKAQPRDERIYFRATANQRQVIEQAAEATGKTLTSFVLEAVCLEAQRTLVDRRLFMVDEDAWTRFNEVLDRPAVDNPRLRELLQTPSILD